MEGVVGSFACLEGAVAGEPERPWLELDDPLLADCSKGGFALFGGGGGGTAAGAGFDLDSFLELESELFLLS